MSAPILATKLYVPPPRPRLVPRVRLIERLDESLNCRLTLISASAGSGKTTLVSDWVTGAGRPVAWLSLDEGDSDPARFLAYVIAALQTIAPGIGEGVLALLKTPQPPPLESILTALLNEIAAIATGFILVLDDYHVLDAGPVDTAVGFLVEHMPPQMHLVIATREDPALPLARLRARGQLAELRVDDLRFTLAEAGGFLNQVMKLGLSSDEVAAFEARTEGWIAGLQLAAISVQGREDAAGFIRSFTGSHRFVLDYLVEEVLSQQSEAVQAFLLRTSILDRLCGPLCDAVLTETSVSGQETLECLERANLFLVPLDRERRWYRYHHLFGDLLRARLQQTTPSESVAELHIRASDWYEANGLEIEAFGQAAAANDVERAERLIEGKGMPLQYRGALAPIFRWLTSLPESLLAARPSLRATYAAVLLGSGRTTGIEEMLQAAEQSLERTELSDASRDLIGRLASTRSMLALSQHRIEDLTIQARRALEYLRPDNYPFRTTASMLSGYACQFQGDRAGARRAYTQALSLSQLSGDVINDVLVSTGLGAVEEGDNHLQLAADTYRHVLALTAELPLPVASEASLGLARISYQWNDLDAADAYWRQSIPLARQLENTDRAVVCLLFLARLKMARGDLAGAAAALAEADGSAREHDFVLQMPEIAAAQVAVLLRQGEIAAATELAEKHDIPLSRARVLLARGDPAAALAAIEPFRRRAEERAWPDEQLKAVVLEAVGRDANGEKDHALRLLGDALALAEPAGFIRLFVDEGRPMARLLREGMSLGLRVDYIRRLLAAFAADELALSARTTGHLLAEPLSKREIEVLALIAEGLTNQEIATRLYLSLHTVKAHARNISAKLDVGNRTQAVARARTLGILSPE
jgi:LuxR family transcriptional regulator, maltose regulon positive regulatory protein